MHSSNLSRAAFLALFSASVFTLAACGKKDEAPAPAPAAPAAAAPQPAASSVFVVGGSASGAASAPVSSMPEAGSMTSTTPPASGTATK